MLDFWKERSNLGAAGYMYVRAYCGCPWCNTYTYRKIITVNLHTNDMSTGQLGSPLVLIVIECDTAWFFGQLDVITQCLEIAAFTVRSLC